MAEITNHHAATGSSARPKTFHRNRLALQLITVLAVVLAFCLGVSIFFRVDTITVFGAERYSAWSVAEASGIQNGDNLLFFGRGTAAGKIKLALPYIDEVRITVHLPGSVNIYVEETDVVYAMQDQANSWWLVTADGKVVENTDEVTAQKNTVIQGIKLDQPQIGAASVALEQPTDGEISAVTNADKLRVALVIARHLERNEILGQAKFVDVTNLQKLILQYGDRFTVDLGDYNSLEEKILVMKSAIIQMGEFQTGNLEIVNRDGKWQVVYS